MAEFECCVPLLRCVEGQTPWGVPRRAGSEECFCVDAKGLAQGGGVFRDSGADLLTTYIDGSRSLVGEHRGFEFINSDGAVIVAVVIVMALSMAGGVLEGLRAMAASLGSWVVALPLSVMGAALGGTVTAMLSPGTWLFFDGAFAGAVLLFGCGVVVGARTLSRQLGVRARRVVWLHALALGAAIGLVVARETKVTRSHAALALAPSLVVGEVR